MSGCLCTLIIVQLTFVLIYFGELYNAKLLSQLSSGTADAISKATVITAIVNEMALSGSLVFLLYRSRNPAPFETSDSLVKRLITFTLSTGVIIVIFGLILLVAHFAVPKTFLPFALDFNVSKRACSRCSYCFAPFKLTLTPSVYQLHVCAVRRPISLFLTLPNHISIRLNFRRKQREKLTHSPEATTEHVVRFETILTRNSMLATRGSAMDKPDRPGFIQQVIDLEDMRDDRFARPINESAKASHDGSSFSQTV